MTPADCARLDAILTAAERLGVLPPGADWAEAERVLDGMREDDADFREPEVMGQ